MCARFAPDSIRDLFPTSLKAIREASFSASQPGVDQV
jgi:hypothetical protein